jgi:hypothetical protein
MHFYWNILCSVKISTVKVTLFANRREQISIPFVHVYCASLLKFGVRCLDICCTAFVSFVEIG